MVQNRLCKRFVRIGFQLIWQSIIGRELESLIFTKSIFSFKVLGTFDVLLGPNTKSDFGFGPRKLQISCRNVYIVIGVRELNFSFNKIFVNQVLENKYLKTHALKLLLFLITNLEISILVLWHFLCFLWGDILYWSAFEQLFYRKCCL